MNVSTHPQNPGADHRPANTAPVAAPTAAKAPQGHPQQIKSELPIPQQANPQQPQAPKQTLAATVAATVQIPFTQLGLSAPLLKALAEEGYVTPTPIQAQAIPKILTGGDLLGCAQTGTGKTAAFALPMLQLLAGRPAPADSAVKPLPPTSRGHHHRGPVKPVRALILAPTRELAAQIGESFRAYGRHVRLTSTVVFGGVGQGPQESALRRGIDILVATPGRLLDLVSQGVARLEKTEILVLDEADRMLDMGFMPDIKRILAMIPGQRQTLFFSATMPREIRLLADNILRNPQSVEVAPVSSAAETVTQGVFFVAKGDKPALLAHLLDDKAVARALVFSRTKHGADKVAKHLISKGVVAEAIHGNKSQNARTRALDGFRSGKVRVLVASDIAARGLDVDGITHVVNVDLPNEPETYVHRIGRTGRAGATGTAWSFCSADERAFLRDIEKTIRRSVPVIAEHPFPDRGVPSSGGGGGGGFGGGQRGGGGYGQRGGGFQRGGGGSGRRDFGGGGRREGHAGSGARDSGRGHGEGRGGQGGGQGGGHRGQGGGQGGAPAAPASGRGGRPTRW